MGVLLARMETNIENAIAVKLVVAINLIAEAELDGVVWIKGQIIKRPQVRSRKANDAIILCAKFGIDRTHHSTARGYLQRGDEEQPFVLKIIFCAKSTL